MRRALAAIAGSASAALVYAVVRIVERVTSAPVDPALVLWPGRSGFFWRCWTAAYAGGAIAFVVWVLAGRAPERVARLLERAVVAAAIAIALVAAFAP